MRMHKQIGEKQPVKFDIRLNNVSGKNEMQLQLEHKIMGSPQVNSQNNIDRNMRFQRNVMKGLIRLPSLRKTLAWAPKGKVRCYLG
jgi:hypothetical protein